MGDVTCKRQHQTPSSAKVEQLVQQHLWCAMGLQLQQQKWEQPITALLPACRHWHSSSTPISAASSKTPKSSPTDTGSKLVHPVVPELHKGRLNKVGFTTYPLTSQRYAAMLFLFVQQIPNLTPSCFPAMSHSMSIPSLSAPSKAGLCRA